MTVNIEETGAGQLPDGLDTQGTAAEVLEMTASFTNAAYELSADVLLCDERTIQDLNRQFRQLDKPTDVLSFPNLEFDAPGEWPDEPGDDLFDPDTGELMLGSIAVCKERVLSQAAEYGHSVRREYAFLLAHSFLHLCGYDHMEEEERLQMEAAQDTVLKRLHITRDK